MFAHRPLVIVHRVPLPLFSPFPKFLVFSIFRFQLPLPLTFTAHCSLLLRSFTHLGYLYAFGLVTYFTGATVFQCLRGSLADVL